MEKNQLIVTYGNEIARMTADLLKAAGLAEMIGNKGASIVIKPNLVVPATPDSGATTHVEIITSLIEYLQANGFSDITVAEGSWVGSRTEDAFKVNGYYSFTRKYGVKLLNLKNDSFSQKSADGIGMQISDTALECDYLINLPVLKGHGQTLMTCALKNMKGILSDGSKRRFHALGLHHPIAALNAIRAADFVLVDSICGDLDFEEGGTPVRTDRMFCGTDSVLIDTFGASLMGFELEEIPYIGLAEELGVGTTDLASAEIISLTTPESAAPVSGKRAMGYQQYCDQRNACSACYGNLVHALRKLEGEGLLHRVSQKGKVRIGQEFRKEKEEGCLGVGNCTGGLAGCPPTANEMAAYLKSKIGK